MKYDIATPYIAIYVLFRKDNTAAFVKRSNTDWMNGFYGLIAGKVEKVESYTQAAIRESQEEAGVTVKAEDLVFRQMTHRHGDDGMDWVDVLFEATAWEGELHNAEPHMHSELTWLALDNLPENIVPNTSYMIECLLKGQTYGEYGWED